MDRYEVMESKVWSGPNGRRVSPYGACPWTSDAERPLWSLVTRGWTIRDNRTNTIGLGRRPWSCREDAQRHCDSLNATGEFAKVQA